MPATDSLILETFLAAGDAPVSGDKIAKSLGVSRVSVWGRLERLRAEGFSFEASTRVGYRLTGVPKKLHAALVTAHLRRAGIATPVCCFEKIDSTNSEAERQLAGGAPAPIVVAANEQTAGRGRLGRAWHSKHAGNLYLSFAFRPFLPPEKMSAFTLSAGLRLCDFLAAQYALPLQIKWPNDLLCAGKKIAGMLTEARIDADHIRDLVFGLGLNVNARAKDFPPELREIAGSLAIGTGKTLEINVVAAGVIAAVLRAYDDFIAGGRGKDFPALWGKYDFLAGKKVSVSMFGKIVSGNVAGLDAGGALLLKDDVTGKTLALNAGEVTLNKEPQSKK